MSIEHRLHSAWQSAIFGACLGLSSFACDNSSPGGAASAPARSATSQQSAGAPGSGSAPIASPSSTTTGTSSSVAAISGSAGAAERTSNSSHAGSGGASASEDAGPARASAGSAGSDESPPSAAPDAGSIFNLFPPPPPAVDAGPPPTMTDGGLTCENLACFDVFDCLLYHPAEFGPCKFTKCDAFICKP